MPQFFDLTHPLTPMVPTWANDLGFQLETVLNYSECVAEAKFCVQRLCMQSGIGTHIDAPAHCFAGAITIDQLPLDRLIVSGIVINITDKAHANYVVSEQDLRDFEAQYGQIPMGSCVIIATGWDVYWIDREKYHNRWQFPVLSAAAAHFLVERRIVGIGIDTLGPDLPDSGYPVHRIFLGQGKYIVENVANAQALPPVGAQIMVMPLRIMGGTESPVRMIAVVP